jgi:hypothetical protein
MDSNNNIISTEVLSDRVLSSDEVIKLIPIDSDKIIISEMDLEKLDRNYFFDQIQSGNKEFIELYEKSSYFWDLPDYIYLDQPTIDIDGAT